MKSKEKLTIGELQHAFKTPHGLERQKVRLILFLSQHSLHHGAFPSDYIEPMLSKYAIGDRVEAAHSGRWHETTVSGVDKAGGTYEVRSNINAATWVVNDGQIRDVSIDLMNVRSVSSAAPEKLVLAVQTSANLWDKKLKKQATSQLQCQINCLSPVAYHNSQHYTKRMIKNGWDAYVNCRKKLNLPCLSNQLVYVAEQEFFGVNMLGSFSACDWGMPEEKHVEKGECLQMMESFSKLCSFGPSCFILDTQKMIHEVIR